MTLRTLSIPFLFASGALIAGNTFITGRLLDKGGEPVIGANVRILTLPDSTFIAASSTDWDGRFRLDSIGEGRYVVVPDAFGMTTSKPVMLKVRPGQDSIPLNEIRLDSKATLLDDLVVTGRYSAVTAKQDTIEFNAASFKTSQNANVEELLKKLPGVEVSSDGTIKSQGKTVSKILVDGEEFFSDDPKMASKNLLSDMIDKVQVLDRQNDESRLTGVDSGEEETVINLTIKKGRKNGWFGNVTAGYGTDSRYNFGFTVNRFVGSSQYTFLGSANNVNDMSFTDMGRGRFRDFGGGNDGITKSQSLGFNFATGSTDRLRVGGNVLYTHSDQDYRKRSETQYLFPDSVSYQNSWSEAKNAGHNIRSAFRIQWKIDDSNTIDFRPQFSFNHRESAKNDTSTLRSGGITPALVNHQDNFQNNRGNSFETSGRLIYSHSFKRKKGRQFSITANYSFSDTRQKGLSLSDITYYLMHEDDEQLYRLLDSHQWSNSVEGRFNWVEPIGNSDGGNFLTFSYQGKYSFNNADKWTYDLPLFEDEISFQAFQSLAMSSEGGTIDESLSNRFRNDFFSQEVQIGYKKEKDKLKLQAGLLFAPSMSKSNDLINPARNIAPRWVMNVAPYMRLRYKFSKNRNLSVNYRARTTQPSLTQLQPVADESDPLHITVGNPDLKPTFNQNVMFRYADFDSETQRSLMAMMHASHSLNSVVSRTTTDANTGIQTTSYANVNNAFSIMAGGMYNQPLGRAHWRISFDMFLNYNNSPGYINGVLNRSGNLSLRPNLGVTFTNDVFQMTLRPQYSLQFTHNSLNQQPNRTVHTYGANADAHLYLPFGLEFSTDVTFSKNTGYASGYDTSQWLWNAELSYSFLKSKSLTAALKVYDILQQRDNISRTVSATNITDAWVNSLTRYAMFSLTYTFQAFGGKNMNGDRFGGEGMPDSPDGPPMGPPPGGRGGMPPGPPPGGGHF